MNLRTELNIVPSDFRITYNKNVLLIGSCFSSAIGNQMKKGKLPVLMNPAGTVYNPVSAGNTLDAILTGKEFTVDDLCFHEGMWLSFYHNTDFSSEDPAKTLGRINSRFSEATEFISKAGFLFITFGTARIYRWRQSGQIVSNCHKIPPDRFSHELLTVKEIVDFWNVKLDTLHSMLPGLKVIFTISPVRHLKDGAHGNQVSKSVLFLAVEALLGHPSGPQYFPSFEILMDDLRDYRFYDEDMVHPSETAINYIWDAFARCYLDAGALKIWTEAAGITKAAGHSFLTDNISAKREFAHNILNQISALERRVPSIDFSEERKYFLSLLNA